MWVEDEAIVFDDSDVCDLVLANFSADFDAFRPPDIYMCR